MAESGSGRFALVLIALAGGLLGSCNGPAKAHSPIGFQNICELKRAAIEGREYEGPATAYISGGGEGFIFLSSPPCKREFRIHLEKDGEYSKLFNLLYFDPKRRDSIDGSFKIKVTNGLACLQPLCLMNAKLLEFKASQNSAPAN